MTGGADGKIYHWVGDQVQKTYENNKGSVHSIACRTDKTAGGEVVLVGGNDKTFSVYKLEGGALKKLWNVQCDSAPRSVDLYNGMFLLGLKNGSICEMKWSADGS